MFTKPPTSPDPLVDFVLAIAMLSPFVVIAIFN